MSQLSVEQRIKDAKTHKELFAILMELHSLRDKVRAAIAALQANCPHPERTSSGGEYFIETCMTCGHENIV